MDIEEPILKKLSAGKLKHLMEKLEKEESEEHTAYVQEREWIVQISNILMEEMKKKKYLSKEVAGQVFQFIRQIRILSARKWGIFARFLQIEHAMREENLDKLDDRLKFAKSTLKAFKGGKTTKFVLKDRLDKLKEIGAEIDAMVGEYNAMHKEAKKDLPKALKQCKEYNDQQIKIANVLRIKILNTKARTPGGGTQVRFLQQSVKPSLNQLLRTLKNTVAVHFDRIERRVNKLDREIRKQRDLAMKRALYIETIEKHLAA